MRWLIVFLISVFALFELPVLNGQQKIEKFEHRNGLIFEGSVIYFDSNIITIQKTNGEIIEFPMETVRIIHGDREGYLHHYNKLWSGLIGIHSGFGGNSDSFLSCLGMHTGVMLKMYGNEKSLLIHHLMAKSGIETYNSIQNHIIMPLTAGYRVGLSGKKISPFLMTSGGYGFNVTSAERNEINVSESFVGGSRWEYGAGMSIKGNNFATDISLSYVSQKAISSYNTPWWDTTTNERFKRIFLNVSINF